MTNIVLHQSDDARNTINIDSIAIIDSIVILLIGLVYWYMYKYLSFWVCYQYFDDIRILIFAYHIIIMLIIASILVTASVVCDPQPSSAVEAHSTTLIQHLSVIKLIWRRVRAKAQRDLTRPQAIKFLSARLS